MSVLMLRRPSRSATDRAYSTGSHETIKMRLPSLLAVWAIVASSMAVARPIVCPDLKRDLILKGELAPEACCSYGRCLGDVVIAMA
ncbi:hypothetical protein QC764_102495 [Podospora pseudoanserina]|uniref:Uncharacterized protein n=1 Tax=Podospora pseudoanserina TaxID=2609844 RepID=A0ABR0IKB7_9PEZI|nr:hypothetical protein QC764_102495 [Podospora pseudoanserina]